MDVRATRTATTWKASTPSCSTAAGLASRRTALSRSPRPTRTAGTSRAFKILLQSSSCTNAVGGSGGGFFAFVGDDAKGESTALDLDLDILASEHDSHFSPRPVDFAVRPAAIPSGGLSGRGSDVYLGAGQATGVGSIWGSVSLAVGGGVSFLSG